MSNARNLARLLPNASGQLPDVNLAAIAAGKVSGQLADSNMSSGSVLQVVETVMTYPESMSTTSWVNIAGLTASITPSTNNSKILILATVNMSANDYRIQWGMRLARNGSPVVQGNAAGSRNQTYLGWEEVSYSGYNITNWRMENFNMHALDAPNTTSQTTYSVQWIQPGSAYGTISVNNTQNDTDNVVYPRGVSVLTLIEIAG